MYGKLILFLLVFIMGCTYFKNPGVPAAEGPVISLSFDHETVKSMSLHTAGLVDQFYKERNFILAWSDSAGRTANADSLITIIRLSEKEGLIPTDYHFAETTNLDSLPLSQANAVAFDLYLTDAFFTLWHHLRYGRVDLKTFVRTDLSASKETQAITALRRSLKDHTFREELGKQFPVSKQYAALCHALELSLTQNLTDSISLKKRRQLVANLERLRWHRERSGRYIQVNVPSFKLNIVEDDSVILESRVIAGKPETPTPELKSIIRSFIIYPYWHVPRSIVKEILPHIQEDTLYLKRHNYDVLDILGKPIKASTVDWPSYNAETFPYVLRQREGSENTMGVIKFIFHNNYGVYLHDTNSRGLFSREGRALSHGCIRVRKAVELARYLIKDDYIVSPEDLDQYMELQRRMEITLPKPILIYLDYFTCEQVNGVVQYYKDVYKKDEQLVKSLNGEIESPI
jgi:L,D-transpeptidase YcbB